MLTLETHFFCIVVYSSIIYYLMLGKFKLRTQFHEICIITMHGINLLNGIH